MNVPKDIRKMAKELDDEFWNQNVPQGAEDFVMDFIIKGMMEERERCAMLAHDYGLDSLRGSEYRLACDDIAEGIRGTSAS